MNRVVGFCLLFSLLAPTNARAEPPHATETREEAVAERAKLRKLHFWLGITTWASTGATTALGTIRYANVVGFSEPRCAAGGAPIFGRSWGCGNGLKIQHGASATFTLASYITTRTVAALMPDPYDAAGQNTAYSRRLFWHRALSWVHLVGMVATPVLGIATSAADSPDERRAWGTAHLVSAYTTFAAISAAGMLMVF